MILGIVGNPFKENLADFVKHILDSWDKNAVLIWDGISDKLHGLSVVTYYSEKELKDRADIIISIGGDGTFLRTARTFIEKPIMGINVGTFGFLTFYSKENLLPALNHLREGKWSYELRTTIKATLPDGKVLIALNDITFNVRSSARMLHAEVKVNGEKLYDFRGDGLIISTPTGSTAYNLSSGGPILYPTMDAFVITPICPHKLSLRPVVVPADSKIEVTVSSRSEEMILSADGQEIIPLTSTTVLLTKCDQSVKIVKTPELPTYFEILKKKLAWG